MEVARDFPHCNAVAVDLVPMQSTSVPYPNPDNNTLRSKISLDQCPRILGMTTYCEYTKMFKFSFRSEIDDINLGLEHFYGDFNVVHARLISSGVIPIYDPAYVQHN
jgi:hypothetical protein